MPRKRPKGTNTGYVSSKVEMTPRKWRMLNQKMGLLKFTPTVKISTAKGIPRSIIETLDRPRVNEYSYVFSQLKKFENDPEKKWLLDTPRLWTFARIKEYAPTQSAPEIVARLKNERKNHPQARKINIPSPTIVKRIIREMNLREPGALEKINSRLRTRRPENKLSPEQRALLTTIGFTFFSKIKVSAEHGISIGEVRSALFDRMMHEVKLIPLDPRHSDSALKRLWLEYLRKRSLNYLRDISRKHGPLSRSGKHRRPLHLEEDLVVPEKVNPWTSKRIKIATKLTRKQRAVLILLQEGYNPKEMARELKMSLSSISHKVREIKKKVIFID